MDQVYAKNAQCVLLFYIGVVEHAHVQDNILGRTSGGGLKTHAHPAVTFFAFFEALRRDGVGKCEESRLIGPVILDA